MDELRIEVDPCGWKLGSSRDGESLPYGGGALTVIHVNNEPLVELVRRCELPSARASGQEGLAGKYRPLWGYRFDPGLFFGRPLDPELRCPSGVVLMGCDCGVVGCWPLECRVTIGHETIMWDQFRQPFRPKWDHSALGPLVFDRGAYEREAASAEERFVELVGRSPEQRRNYEQRNQVLSSRDPGHEWPDWPTVSGTPNAEPLG